MTIIEVDGNNIVPLVVDSIQIYAGKIWSRISLMHSADNGSFFGCTGQRYSFIVSITMNFSAWFVAHASTELIAPRQPEDQ